MDNSHQYKDNKSSTDNTNQGMENEEIFQDPPIIEEGKEHLPGIKNKLTIPVSFKTILVSFLKQLALNPTDLHQLNCPSIILNGISLLEYSIYWADHPNLLFDIIKENENIDKQKNQSPIDPSMTRILKITRWFLSTLWDSYRSRNSSTGFERKPYNPVLGEQFQCEWDNQIEMISEQVCHHPPISAFYFKTKDDQLHVNGYSGQKTAFTGTAIKVTQEGLITMNLFIKKDKNSNNSNNSNNNFNRDRIDKKENLNENIKEEYQITLPELHIRGLLIGMPFLEITGETTIFCPQTGWKCHLKFLPKPWFTGEYDFVEGLIYKKSVTGDSELQDTIPSHSCSSFNKTKDGINNNSTIEIWGKWSETIWYKIKNETNESESENEDGIESEDENDCKSPSVYDHLEKVESGVIVSSPQDEILYKVGEMDAIFPTRTLNPPDPLLDSRIVWKSVTDALMEGDYEKASAIKNEIEENQRRMKRERDERGVNWRPLLFEKVENYNDKDDCNSTDEIITADQKWVNGEFYQKYILNK